jgi:hypothetical protein
MKKKEEEEERKISETTSLVKSNRTKQRPREFPKGHSMNILVLPHPNTTCSI